MNLVDESETPRFPNDQAFLLVSERTDIERCALTLKSSRSDPIEPEVDLGCLAESMHSKPTNQHILMNYKMPLGVLHEANLDTFRTEELSVPPVGRPNAADASHCAGFPSIKHSKRSTVRHWLTVHIL